MDGPRPRGEGQPARRASSPDRRADASDLDDALALLGQPIADHRPGLWLTLLPRSHGVGRHDQMRSLVPAHGFNDSAEISLRSSQLGQQFVGGPPVPLTFAPAQRLRLLTPHEVAGQMHADRAARPTRDLVLNFRAVDRQVANGAGLAAAPPGAGLTINRQQRATPEAGLDGIQEWVIRLRRRAEQMTAARY